MRVYNRRPNCPVCNARPGFIGATINNVLQPICGECYIKNTSPNSTVTIQEKPAMVSS